MARPGTAPSAVNGGRKRLVQPALPVLPLLSKPVKEPTKATQQDKLTSNGAVPQVQVTDEPIPDAQVVEPHVFDKTSEKEHARSIPALVDNTSTAETQNGESGSAEKDLSLVPDYNTPTAPVPDTSTMNPPEIFEPETNNHTTRDETSAFASNFASTPVELAAQVPLNEDSMAGTNLDTEGQISEEPAVKPVKDTAKSNVEASMPMLHSTNPSISDTSIHQTPTYAAALPVSPEPIGTPQNHLFVNGHAEASPDVLPNGHGSPPGQQGTSNDGRVPHVRQQIPTVPEHIRTLLFMPEWYDCEICVYASHSSKPSIYRNAHSLVLIRSERLRNFIFPQRANSYTYYCINLAPSRSIDTNAFDAALRFLYDDTVLSAERLFPSQTTLDNVGRAGALNYVMSYLIAGLELGLEPVTTRALDLIGRLLDWDLAELAIKEASQLRSSSAPTSNPHAPSDALAAAKSIFQHVFNLIILRLDVKNFKVDAVTNPVELTSRFASLEGGRAVVNPALANMVFGSMPASGSLSPPPPQVTSSASTSSTEAIASVIMLNMEYTDLRALTNGLEKAHGEDGLRVINQVVDERERRRLEVVNSRPASINQYPQTSTTFGVIGYREFLEKGVLNQERAGNTAKEKHIRKE